MKANKDPKIEIKDCDRNHYHVEHTRIELDRTGKHPTINKRMQVYDRKDYDRMFGPKRSPHAGLGAMNDDEVRVVHDPVLQIELDDEAFMKQVKADEAKAKRTAKPKVKTD